MIVLIIMAITLPAIIYGIAVYIDTYNNEEGLESDTENDNEKGLKSDTGKIIKKVDSIAIAHS